MELYANDLKFTGERQLETQELNVLAERMTKAGFKDKWRFRLTVFTLYLCLAVACIVVPVVYALSIDSKDLLPVLFLFSGVFPAFSSSMQEIFLPANRYLQSFFIFLYLFLLGYPLFSAVLPDGANTLVMLLIWAVGWVMLLLRWSDCKRSYPLYQKANEDLAVGKVNCFAVSDENQHLISEGVSSIEVLPNSHFIYAKNDEVSWPPEIADVRAVASVESETRHQLVPSTVLAERVDNVDYDFYQRALSYEEIEELDEARKRLRKQLPIFTLGSLWVSMFVVRSVENMMAAEVSSSLSFVGLLLALLIGLIFPIKKLNVWRKIGKDLKAKLLIYAFKKADDVASEEPEAAFLLHSKLLWRDGKFPSHWRYSDL